MLYPILHSKWNNDANIKPIDNVIYDEDTGELVVTSYINDLSILFKTLIVHDEDAKIYLYDEDDIIMGELTYDIVYGLSYEFKKGEIKNETNNILTIGKNNVIVDVVDTNVSGHKFDDIYITKAVFDKIEVIAFKDNINKRVIYNDKDKALYIRDRVSFDKFIVRYSSIIKEKILYIGSGCGLVPDKIWNSLVLIKQKLTPNDFNFLGAHYNNCHIYILDSNEEYITDDKCIVSTPSEVNSKNCDIIYIDYEGKIKERNVGVVFKDKCIKL